MNYSYFQIIQYSIRFSNYNITPNELSLFDLSHEEQFIDYFFPSNDKSRQIFGSNVTVDSKSGILLFLVHI